MSRLGAFGPERSASVVLLTGAVVFAALGVWRWGAQGGGPQAATLPVALLAADLLVAGALVSGWYPVRPVAQGLAIFGLLVHLLVTLHSGPLGTRTCSALLALMHLLALILLFARSGWRDPEQAPPAGPADTSVAVAALEVAALEVAALEVAALEVAALEGAKQPADGQPAEGLASVEPAGKEPTALEAASAWTGTSAAGHIGGPADLSGAGPVAEDHDPAGEEAAVGPPVAETVASRATDPGGAPTGSVDEAPVCPVASEGAAASEVAPGDVAPGEVIAPAESVPGQTVGEAETVAEADTVAGGAEGGAVRDETDRCGEDADPAPSPGEATETPEAKHPADRAGGPPDQPGSSDLAEPADRVEPVVSSPEPPRPVASGKPVDSPEPERSLVGVPRGPDSEEQVR